jgi:multiple sugar transport system ATP-binding protein
MTSVQLRHVGKVYPDGHRAVDDVDLVVDDGEFFVLVGPSGCGKTSVLRMVAGLELLSQGDILVDGTSVTKLHTNERNLAMLFQTSALYPNMTVRQNLGFPLAMAKVEHREIERRVVDLASRMGLTDQLDERPHRLSGGQRQRVAMGRALVRDPRLLLMDEPMSNLDAKLRTELRGEIAVIQRRLGVTTLYVTHDQVEAMALGDRVAVMRSGRVIQCGAPDDVYQHPVDVFVAQFMGTPPMNVVDAQLDGGLPEPTLRVGPNVIPIGEASRRWPTLDDHRGRHVALGLRPEAVEVHADGQLSVEVTAAQRMGSARLVHATLHAAAVSQSDDRVVIAAEPSSTIAFWMTDPVEANLWKPIRLRVDPHQLHLFDLGSGAAL